MLDRLLRRRLDAFEREWGYDAAYMRDVLRVDRLAFLKFSLGTGFALHRAAEAPAPAWYGAKLAAALWEDCGPCAQLAADMAVRGGVPAETVRGLAEGRPDMDGDAALGFAFARAVLARDDQTADRLRTEIAGRWGERALVSISLALTGARTYPTLKRALGRGRECRRLTVAGEAVTPRAAPRPLAA